MTGPTIINFQRKLHTIMDRCDYDLWQSVNHSITLRGHFQERLWKDVIFLDGVTLLVGNDTVTLGQGGTVLVRGCQKMLFSKMTDSVIVSLQSEVLTKVEVSSTLFFCCDAGEQPTRKR